MHALPTETLHFYLIVGLILLLFLKDEIMPYAKHWFAQLFGMKERTEDLPATREQMDRLSSYYNHDTTILLQSIDANLTRVHAAITDLSKAVEELDKSVDKLHTTQQEWEKYGVPTRPNK